ncbi:MAG TPA: DUF2892 domain-containing protein [Methylocella sp.]|nr:DUF2892 domain-containing protein [Methylocella sp.]
MVKNVGTIDRAARAAAGLILLSALMFAGSGWKWLAALAGLVLVVTAFIGWCPAYGAFGIKTCAPETRK